MIDLKQEFLKFMSIIELKLKDIGISINSYSIDHVCFRVDNQKDFRLYTNKFKSLSKVYSMKILHDRKFYIFVLKIPLKYKGIEIPYIELSEPGGSDNYSLGFQHIEFHSNVNIKDLIKNRDKLDDLLYRSKKSNEVYLKWPDKITNKVTKKAIITKALLEDNPTIYLND